MKDESIPMFDCKNFSKAIIKLKSWMISISQFQFPISICSQLQFFLKASVSKLKLPALVCRDGAPAGPSLRSSFTGHLISEEERIKPSTNPLVQSVLQNTSSEVNFTTLQLHHTTALQLQPKNDDQSW